jgi:hypothetical protein
VLNIRSLLPCLVRDERYTTRIELLASARQISAKRDVLLDVLEDVSEDLIVREHRTGERGAHERIFIVNVSPKVRLVAFAHAVVGVRGEKQQVRDLRNKFKATKMARIFGMRQHSAKNIYTYIKWQEDRENHANVLRVGAVVDASLVAVVVVAVSTKKLKLL